MDDVREGRLTRPDGRIVAWTECGPRDGRPLLRLPGTPGSRFSLRPDRTPWHKRGLRMITVERPGLGASARLPGRGFAEHADALAAILDHLAIDRLPVIGGSGGAPHVLAFASRHPGRVTACTVGNGAAPMTDDEILDQVDVNVSADALARAGKADELRAMLCELRASVLADPGVAFRALMDDAPAEDKVIMADPAWQAANARGIVEALAPGVDGWVDETLAILGDWPDVEIGSVTCSVTWWHSVTDRNCPFTAARRLVDRLPRGTMLLEEASGHLLASALEGPVLDELLARA
jgi:pimeloyl-ACP methyl ester carboxylesterase